ncbi:MAG: hypothetical protein QOJ35_2065 [Solirubrobacteraceae bacterium]|nr:hypothetical protein [Solirubrobacteraceae bacterium]
MIDGMELVGAWLRQLWRAGTAAAIVPIAIVAALVVAVAGAGGPGGLGSLGQLVTGPDVSPLPTDVPHAVREGARVRDLALVAPPTFVAAVRPAPAAAAGRARAPATAPAPQRVLPRRPRPARNPPVGAVHRPPPPPPPPVAPAPRPAPPTARDRAQALVGGLGQAVDDVGSVVGEVIGNLGEAAGGILGGPPPAR